MSTPHADIPQPTARLVAGPGVFIVLSGPSGVGKDTLLQRLFERDSLLHYSVSYTTRPPREGEVDGVSYVFVSEQTFWELALRGELLEWAFIHGHWYGSSMGRIQGFLDRKEDVVLKIDVQGAASIRERVSGNAVFIFVAPPSFEELERRLTERRTESSEDLSVRLANARNELEQASHYDAVVVNDDIDKAVDAILTIVHAHRIARKEASTS